ncbi:MAG: glycosyltransferase family 39 protein [Candidatus Omnitrophica bacterium]|nr:glycosyltransferase family 39 protein [Candidatus Omnitrophota bacterium]MDD5591963.1 glycosyltransferase family 39 protein [Candidatus Omnitrophota bacterium]
MANSQARSKDIKTTGLVQKTESLALLSVLLLAVFLRLFRLGYQSLWIDEINAVLMAGKSIFKIIFAGDTTPPFIYLVNHLWQKLGTSDSMVRFPAAIFGVLSVYAAYKLAKALLGKKEAFLTAFIISISLYHIIYSQEAARPYTAFIFFSLISLYCLCQILNTNRNKYWAGFIIFNVFNLYTQLFAIFVLTSEIIIWLVFIFQRAIRKKGNYKSVINSMLKFGLGIIGIIVLSLPVSIQFISAAESELTPGRVVLNPIYYKNLLCRYGAGNGLQLFIYNFFFISGLISLFRGDKRKETGLLIFWLVFPFFLLSFMELKHFFHIRYVIFTYPAYIIIVSKGITNFLNSKYILPRKNALTAVILIIFASLSYLPLKLYYQMPARLTDWRGAARYIYDNAKDGAMVITNGVHDTLIKYYLEKETMQKKMQVISHDNILQNFRNLLLYNNDEVYYVGYGEDVGYGTDIFSLLAEEHFKNKEVFFSPVYAELGKRELIDWDGNSWVDVGVRGYRLVVYFNKN